MALPDLANAPISFTHKRNDKVLRGVRVRPDIRLGYFIVITSHGEYSEIWLPSRTWSESPWIIISPR